MKMVAVRLHEGQDLKETIEQVVSEKKLSSATVISAVGSLSRVRIRMAGAKPDKQDIRDYDGAFEIVSLIGNLGLDRTHLHISFSDINGQVIGGHLKEGCVIHTTVELVLAVDDEQMFTTEIDPQTGFEELKIA